MESYLFQSEEEFLKLCIKGDEDAWAYLVDKFSPLIRWAIRHKLSRYYAYADIAEIDDIFQQTFLRIWQNNSLQELKSPKSIPAYLVIIAQNLTIDFLKTKKKTVSLETAEIKPRRADSSEAEEEIGKILDTLTVKEKRIMSLELFYGLKHKEIAEIMALPINTVSTIVSRTRQVLKDKLEERGFHA